MDAWYKRNSIFKFMSYLRSTLEHSLLLRRLLQIGICNYSKVIFYFERRHQSMANYARFIVIVVIIVGTVCGEESSELEDVDRHIFGLNLPYGRGLDSELQLARLMLVPRLCHPKRNSEIINSLLGLPKNMHNAGKRK